LLVFGTAKAAGLVLFAFSVYIGVLGAVCSFKLTWRQRGLLRSSRRGSAGVLLDDLVQRREAELREFGGRRPESSSSSSSCASLGSSSLGCWFGQLSRSCVALVVFLPGDLPMLAFATAATAVYAIVTAFPYIFNDDATVVGDTSMGWCLFGNCLRVFIGWTVQVVDACSPFLWLVASFHAHSHRNSFLFTPPPQSQEDVEGDGSTGLVAFTVFAWWLAVLVAGTAVEVRNVRVCSNKLPCVGNPTMSS